jgi:subtilisin family serine protease
MSFFLQQQANWQRLAAVSVMISTMALFAGCGGGGGGDSASNPPQSPTANATLSINSGVTYGSVTTTYEAASVMVDYGARAHLADVGPFPDLPGKGTTIVVIDDFESIHASTTTFPLINRVINAHTTSSNVPERYSATYSVPYQIDTSFTHGDLVASIAGGYATGPSSLTLKVPAYDTADLVECIKSYPTTQLSCPSAFHTNAPASTLTAKLSMPPIPGVASEALVQGLHANLSSTQIAADTNATLHGHLISSLKSTTVDVINMSLGADMPLSTDLAKDIQTIMDAYAVPNTIPINAVITISAGNSSTPCGINYFGCNIMAMALVLPPSGTSLSTTANSTLVVGALTGTGSAQKIARYSTLPGDLASRLIFASGDTGFYGNAVGTSFAAPRVAGVAAIIKQQYSTLTSDQIATIILKSGDRDMNNDGTPDFSGVDPIFGNGKLSLKNALVEAEKCFNNGC